MKMERRAVRNKDHRDQLRELFTSQIDLSPKQLGCALAKLFPTAASSHRLHRIFGASAKSIADAATAKSLNEGDASKDRAFQNRRTARRVHSAIFL